MRSSRLAKGQRLQTAAQNFADDFGVWRISCARWVPAARFFID